MSANYVRSKYSEMVEEHKCGNKTLRVEKREEGA